ncbi:alpha/beta-hydrolase [Mytilinidion resinicola]|uniref:Alpha/beta-hydrolase n=1 Tax=Mytilinidion resinicola TaxID=574789 RepID=A0A6A6YK07_9PEZI|nr:alpha/beta-hydrolase [Mytilinidion resinicola]KAF2809120.1 alpha/beta-hydrolase [Mytilinidion resinicola]
MSETRSTSDKFYNESISVLWHDGVEFFTKRWVPKDSSPPRALVIFLHGFAEHIERYDHVWPRFAAEGFEVFGYDQRGFGKTGPRYGDTTLEKQVADLEYAIQAERKRLDGGFDKETVPIYLYGHSMGGGIILSLMTRPRGKRENSPDVRNMISGVICGAPWILRMNPPPKVLLWLIPYIAWIYPNLPLTKALNSHHLTSDPEVAEKIQSDPFFRGDIFIKTVSGMLFEGYRILSEGYGNWPGNLPILITHGEKDPSTSPEASRKFIEKLDVRDKEFKSWPDMLHEGHNERLELRDPFLEYSIR